MFIKNYFITIYIIPEKAQDMIKAIKQIYDLDYGHYKGVYFQSEIGEEYYQVTQAAEPGKEIDPDKVYSHKTVKLEFSIPRNKNLLKKTIQTIWEHHPWKEPVIRMIEGLDSKKD